jgi:hypothetical protein
MFVTEDTAASAVVKRQSIVRRRGLARAFQAQVRRVASENLNSGFIGGIDRLRIPVQSLEPAFLFSSHRRLDTQVERLFRLPSDALCWSVPLNASSNEPREDSIMEKRKLGSQGLEVSELGLGCMGMSQFYGPRDDNESAATLERAIAEQARFEVRFRVLSKQTYADVAEASRRSHKERQY